MSWESCKSGVVAVERFVIAVAAFVSIVPLVLYAWETQDRRIDRAANFISAYATCAELDRAANEDFLSTDWEALAKGEDGEINAFIDALSTYASATDDLLKQLRQEIVVQCNYIKSVNKDS